MKNKYMETLETRLKKEYLPKFKRELTGGISKHAIFKTITMMRFSGMVTRFEADIITDCYWLALGELSQSKANKAQCLSNVKTITKEQQS